MQQQSFSIDKLVEYLQTEDGKIAATLMAVDRGIPVSPNSVTKLMLIAFSADIYDPDRGLPVCRSEVELKDYYRPKRSYDLLEDLSRKPEDVLKSIKSYKQGKGKKYEPEVNEVDKLYSEVGKAFIEGLLGGEGLFGEGGFSMSVHKTALDQIKKAKRKNLSKSAKEKLYSEASETLIYAGNFIDAYKLQLDIEAKPGNVNVPMEMPLYTSAPGIALATKSEVPLIDRIYIGGIMWYESHGMFKEAAQLEMLSGNQERARNYAALSLLFEDVKKMN